MRLLKMTLYLACITLGLLGILCWYAFTQLQPNAYKDECNTWLKTHVHPQLHIDGDIRWSTYPWRGLELHDINLDNPNGFAPQHLLHVGTLQVSVDWLPLLKKQLHISQLHLSNVELTLMQTADGRANWLALAAHPINAASNKAATPNTPYASKSRFTLTLNKIGVSDSRVRVYQQQELAYTLDQLQLQSNATDTTRTRLALTLRGRLQTPYIKQPQPLRISALLRTDQADRLTWQNIQLHSEPISATGTVVLLTEQRPWLQRLSVQGQVTIAALRGQQWQIDGANLPIAYTQGQLHVSPITLQLPDGQYRGEVHADLRQKPWQFRATQHLEQLPSSVLFALLADISRGFRSFNHVMRHMPIEGQLTVDSTLQASGQTRDSLLRSTQGNVKFALQQGKIQGLDVLLLLVNSLTQTAPASSTVSGDTPFAHLTGTLQIQHGIVRNDDLQLNSAVLRLTGKGAIDLPREQINYALTGNRLKRDGTVQTPTITLALQGPLAQPQLRVDTQALLQQAAEKYQDKLRIQIKTKLGKDVLQLLQF